MCGLFAAVDVEPSPCPGSLVFVPCCSVITLLDLLGITWVSFNFWSARGLYDDGDPAEPGGVGFAEATYNLGTFSARVLDDQRASSLASLEEGNFLVRPRPVAMPIGPYVGPALLLLLALTGLVMVRTHSG